MIKKITKCLWICLLILQLSGVIMIEAQAKEMKIHVIHLETARGKTGEHGDAILLKSGNQYLLIDTGLKEISKSVIRYLKKYNIKKISIFLSHMHDDHMGGVPDLIKNKSIKVQRVYMPDKRYASGVKLIETGYKIVKKSLKKYKVPATYVKVGDSLTIGDAKLSIIGPVGQYSRKLFYRAKYINNYSLTTMITCGNIKFLSAGDIYQQEENNLIARYGSRLKADIAKINHHGLDTSNSQKWIDTVKASYVFASNDDIYPNVRARFPRKTNIAVTGRLRSSFMYIIKDNQITLKKS